MNHAYVSTYCQHDAHHNCRLFCKVCKAECLCRCHVIKHFSYQDEVVKRISNRETPDMKGQ